MANEEHHQLLIEATNQERKQQGAGRELWNNWRIANPEVIPNLSNFGYVYAVIGGELGIGHGENFRGFDFRNTNFINSSFSNVNLEEANLREANLENANFSRGSFRRANFEGAILTETCLENWHTNSETNLDSVTCECVYLKYPRQERRPLSDTEKFALGEFTKLFQKARETVDFIFLSSFWLNCKRKGIVHKLPNSKLLAI